MRAVLVATAVVGALAIGGLPALALTLAADEAGPGSAVAARVGQTGPPPWARGHAYGLDKPHAKADEKASAKALKREQKRAWKESRGGRPADPGPPPWAGRGS